MNQQSKSPPLAAKAAIAFSVILSVALGALMVSWLKEPGTQQSVIETNLISSAPEVRIEELRVPVFVTNQFHWREIESTNFTEYAANLRRIGCPERTVSDILRAELRAILRAREQALRMEHAGRSKKERLPAGSTYGEQRHRLKLDYWNQLQQLALLPDPMGDMAGGDRTEMIAIFQFFLGPMSSEEKFNQVLMAVARADAEEDRRQGRGDDTNAPAAKPISELFADDMRRILSASEFQEMAARSATIRLLNGGPYSEVLQLTPQELRQLAVMQTRDDSRLLFLDSIGDSDSDPTFGLRITNNVETLLGADRARLFWLANEREFQSIHEFTANEKLPVATAVQLHELRELAAAELKRTRQEFSEDETERVQRMLEIEAETRSAAREILGKTGYEKFLGSGGHWLTNGGSL